jgi:uncharacterized heparinase superfamily protein
VKQQHQLAVAGRYIRTLRHLRFSQLRGQVITRLKKQWRDPAKMLAGQPASWKLSLHLMELDLCPPVPAQDAEALARGTFCFVNQTANLGFPVDWSAKGMPRLWSYNLHYFDWLWSFLDERSKTEDERWESAKRLTHDWMINHPPSKTAEGWEPYPVSLRLINWSLLYGVKHRDLVQQDEAFQLQLLESIGRQVKWLELNLETHIQANHLLENLAALVCVACVFEGDEANRVLSRYLPMLNREIDEQFLADGMHYERSPMYHLRVLWLVEMLGAAGSPEVQVAVSEVGGKMKRALGCLRHPDEEISQFNDAVIGIYQDNWRTKPESGSWALPEAGYYGYRNDEGDYLAIDAGAVGPDYQPAHAHADFLSFELSLAGHRVVTDTGVGTYEIGSQRLYDRSTAAHSTVEVDDENSVEVWSGFRVGRRTEPRVLRWEPREDGCFLEAEHYGYNHLPSRAIHRRTFEWQTAQIEIRDQITISESVNIASRIHLAPEVEIYLVNNKAFCRISELAFTIEIDGVGKIKLQESDSFKYFGQSQRRKILVIETLAAPPSLAWVWRLTKE